MRSAVNTQIQCFNIVNILSSSIGPHSFSGPIEAELTGPIEETHGVNKHATYPRYEKKMVSAAVCDRGTINILHFRHN